MAIAGLVPAIALADLNLAIRADGQYEQSSNVFDLVNGLAPTTGTGSRADSFGAYGGDLNSTYTWSRQTFTAELSGREYRYDRYSELDHDDYNATAAWKWKLGSILDGLISVTRNRQMVAFSDFFGSSLLVQTNQEERVGVNVQVTPEWRIETLGSSSTNDSPRPGLPDLSLRQNFGQLGFNYVGWAALSAGISGRYLTGTYAGTGTSADVDFYQTTTELDASYRTSPDSRFDASLGYSHRASASGVDDLSAVTGYLDYKRSLTAKTSFKLALAREVNSYITNTGSEIDSSAKLEVNYQATHKISFNPSFAYTYSDLPKQALDGVARNDHYRVLALNFDYRLSRLIELQPYARFESRTSNLVGAKYSANIYGIFGYLHWQAIGTEDAATQGNR